MPIGLLPTEQQILSKPANAVIRVDEYGLSRATFGQLMFLIGMTGKEAIGGRLYLTSYRLAFQAHAINRLDNATYKDCGQQANQVARYLVTGNPQSLDAQYLGERTDVLRQPQGVQDAYIRVYVNQLLAQCDQAERAAIAAKQAEAQAAIHRVSYAASCSRLGGSLAVADFGELVGSVRDPHIAWVADTYKKGQCIVTYYVSEIGQSLTYALPLASNGSFDRKQYNYNSDVRCQGHPEDFRSDTGVCLVVGFLS